MTAVEALKAEANDTHVSFEYDGETYTVERDIDYEVVVALEGGRLAAAIEGLLGEDQHTKFRSKKRKLTHVMAFVEAASKASGADLGK